MFETLIKISGITFEVLPYTERRRSHLNALNAEIEQFVTDNAALPWDELTMQVKGGFWQRKAAILLRPTVTLPEGFFTSEDFEHTLLRKVEDFFLASRTSL